MHMEQNHKNHKIIWTSRKDLAYVFSTIQNGNQHKFVYLSIIQLKQTKNFALRISSLLVDCMIIDMFTTFL